MSAAVVMLPTAAPKKVRQCRSRTRAADRKALLRFPTVYQSPWERQREARKAEQRELAMQADLPSLFLIVRAMAHGMSVEDQRRTGLRLLFSAGVEGGPEAIAWWNTFVGDTADLYRRDA